MYITREMKKHKHRSRMTVVGSNIKYQVDVGIVAAHLENDKLLFNRFLSRKNAAFNINFCTMTSFFVCFLSVFLFSYDLRMEWDLILASHASNKRK